MGIRVSPETGRDPDRYATLSDSFQNIESHFPDCLGDFPCIAQVQTEKVDLLLFVSGVRGNSNANDIQTLVVDNVGNRSEVLQFFYP